MKAEGMCGRFTQHLSWEELHRLADLIGQPRNLAPRFNIAPTTQIEVIRPTAAGNELVPMRWGLAALVVEKAAQRAAGTINARAKRRISERMAVQHDAGLMNKGGDDQKSGHRVSEKPGDLPTLAERSNAQRHTGNRDV